jgi:hypothetical protein
MINWPFQLDVRKVHLPKRIEKLYFGWGKSQPLLPSLPRPARAISMHSINALSSSGLLRKPTAPASKARARSLSSRNADTKMMGVRNPASRRCPWRSRPLMPGIRRSVMRHVVSPTQPDSRNFLADGKVLISYPSD